MLNAFFDLLLPPLCLGCDRAIAPGDSRRLVCRRCRTQLRAAPPPICTRCDAPLLITGRTAEPDCPECREWPAELVRAGTAYLMHPPADRIVHQLKYRGWSALADVLAEAMADRARTLDLHGGIHFVTAVPTTRSRALERGYNQAELIARAVAGKLNCAYENLLERTASKNTQTTLQPAARGANVAGAFRLRSEMRRQVVQAHILLIDDVLTTGATVIECTRTLIEGGGSAVSVLTYARAVDSRRLLAR